MVQVQDSMIGAASVGVGGFGRHPRDRSCSRSAAVVVVVVRWCDCNMCVLKNEKSSGLKTRDKRAAG